MQIFVIIWFVVFFYIIAKGIGQFIENENSSRSDGICHYRG